MKLSVIIPVYNVEKYLAKCLDSVLIASEIPYELILVNDGSTDGSAAILEEYRARFPELVTVITKENGGLGSARNVGLAKAAGEYLYFLDSDDALAPGGMEGILSCTREDFDICLFDSVTVSESGRELAYVRGCMQSGNITLGTYPALLLQIPNVWNKIIRRSFFLDSGLLFPERAWFEDVRVILKLYALTDSIVYKPEAWHRYLLRGGSITNSKNALRNREMIEAMDDLLSFYRAHGLADQLRDELEYLVFYNEFLTSSVRANLADPRAPVQEELRQHFLSLFPQYRKNPYYRKESLRHRVLSLLLYHRMRLCVHLLMRANNLVKKKSV